jgi:transposase
METNKKGAKMSSPSPRRQYDTEFKKSAVQLVLHGQSVPSVSQSLGVSESLLYKWRAEFSEPNKEDRSENALQVENETLRKQVRQLEIERDILKKALGIFSRVT